MKRLLGLAFALTLVAGVAAGCGNKSDSSSGSTTTAAAEKSGGETNEGSSESSSGSSNTGNEKVDAFCNQVNEYAAAVKEAATTKDPSKLEGLSTQGQDLASSAAGLAGEVMKDPSLGEKVQQCSKEASDSLRELSQN